MTLIIIALALSAIYSGGTYIYVYVMALRGLVEARDAELNTFHLGLCFILSVGFLGIILGQS
jgi:hypothetical protein